MKLPSTIRFADLRLKQAFKELANGDDAEQKLFQSINHAFDMIQDDAFCGIQIPKRQIPKEYIRKYGIKNLRKYNLPEGWRLIYSIRREEIIVISLILEWFDHKSYARRFHY
ncbi:MAG: hypothetical protein KJ955_07175 [Nanoarchaeota archaeon]|nr:hypothetical protein [Nanoarchaeota archaeon]